MRYPLEQAADADASVGDVFEVSSQAVRVGPLSKADVVVVAALYVDEQNGPYPAMPNVECWGVARDARQYEGPYPVVAHPPCGHWGALSWNCKQPESWRECGPRAVEQVRAYGGVLEHPAGSKLWRHCGIPKPGEMSYGDPGFSVVLNQVDFGHRARKRTWLYVVGVERAAVVLPAVHLKPTRVMGVSLRKGRKLPCLPKKERHLTPPAFAEWLVGIARGVGQ